MSALLFLVGLSALGGGYYGAVAGAPEVPLEWLQGTPFDTYLIPSLILAVVVGGSSLYAGYAVLRGSHRARASATIAGVVLLGWILAQVSMIGFVSWLQPVMAGAALLILARSRSAN